jgi:hypothetical protein
MRHNSLTPPSDWSLLVAGLALKNFRDLTSVESETVYDRFVIRCPEISEPLLNILCSQNAACSLTDPFSRAYRKKNGVVFSDMFQAVLNVQKTHCSKEGDNDFFSLAERSESNLKLIAEMLCYEETPEHGVYLDDLSARFSIDREIIMAVDLDIRHRKQLSKTNHEMTVSDDRGICHIFFIYKGDSKNEKDTNVYGVWKFVGVVLCDKK